MHSPATDTGTLQKYARGLGAGFTLIGALMSASAGYKFGGDSMFASLLLAALLGGLTVAVALMLNFVDLAWSAGERKIGAGIFAAFVLCLIGEYASHVAFGTGHRAANIETATIQNTRYADTREQVEDTKASLALFMGRLAKLEEANAWAPTVTADALRVEAKSEEMKGGCKARCLAIQAKIAIAEEAGELRKQIAATNAVIAKHRQTAATTEKGDSIAMNQSQLYATAFTGSLTPSAASIAWANIFVGAYLSMLSTGLGALFNWLGFHTFKCTPDATPVSDLGNRNSEDRAYPRVPRETISPRGMPAEPIHIHTVERITDKALRNWSMSDDVRAMLAGTGQQLKAA